MVDLSTLPMDPGVPAPAAVHGDELWLHPDAPDRILVLPRKFETVHAVKGGLLPALDWALLSGNLAVLVHGAAFNPDAAGAT